MAGYEEVPIHFLATSDDYYHQVLERLVDPNEKDIEGNTLLHSAAQSLLGNSRILQLLIDQGADVDATTPDGHTPLHFAVVNRKFDAVVALVEAGASIQKRDFMGRTALHLSICKKESYFLVLTLGHDRRILERLLCHPEICLNPVDHWGETPLMWAVKERNLSAMIDLLEKGANPNIPNKDNQTPLHVALSARNLSMDPTVNLDNIIIRLLAKGAGIYHEDKFRQTPVNILFSDVHNRPLSFAVHCLWLIALKFHIKSSLERELAHMPDLSAFLDDCCREVRLMKKVVIYDNVTLHDFSLNCFQTRLVADPVREIYIPVAEFLLTGVFQIYYHVMLRRFSKQNLQSALEIIVGGLLALAMAPQDASHSAFLDAIACAYEASAVLSKRLLRIRKTLKKKI